MKDTIVALKTGSYDEVTKYEKDIESVVDSLDAILKIEKIDGDDEIDISNSIKYVRDKYSYLLT